MTQRIRQLAEQATTYHNGGLGTEIELFDKEKFAELIVRECCDIVNKHKQRNNPNDCVLVLDIKEHFGVEE